jgi:hypothetical protein
MIEGRGEIIIHERMGLKFRKGYQGQNDVLM